MTTTTNDTVERYTISGAGPYAFSFRIFDETDLTVTAISGSTVVPLALDSHYTVPPTSVNRAAGGSIDLTTGPTGAATLYAGYTLDIRSNTPVDQPTSIRNSSRFLPEIHEDAFDYLSRQNQDAERRASLSPRLPDNEIAPDWATLLSLANRKGKYGWFFNATTGAPELVSGFSTTAITQGNVGAALYPQTAAELAAGVTPTNYYIPSHAAIGHVLPARYGGVSDATTNANTALANALLVCAQARSPLNLGDGLGYLVTTNLSPAVGNGNAVDIIGSGWTTGGILFSGAGVTTGLTFTGSSYSYAGTVRDLRIRCQSGAIRGITVTDCTNFRLERSFITGAAGAGVALLGTLMSDVSHVLLTSCGSATEGSFRVDRSGSIASTTTKMEHLYISGGNTTVGGLTINRSYHVTIIGGAIESSGIPLRIGNETDTTVGCVTGIIDGVDFENPGNNPYIEMGAGCSSSALVASWRISNCNGSPSGSTTVPHAVQATATRDLRCFGNNWALPNGTSFHEFEGTGNRGQYIDAHWQLFAVSGVPWVRVNNVQQMTAGPQAAWYRDSMLPGVTTEKTVSGTDPNASVDATQGGYHSRILVSNGGATNMATLTNLQEGAIVYLRFANANTTLVHNPGVADAFRLTAGVNLTPASGTLYGFIRGATDLVQIA